MDEQQVAQWLLQNLPQGFLHWATTTDWERVRMVLLLVSVMWLSLEVAVVSTVIRIIRE